MATYLLDTNILLSILEKSEESDADSQRVKSKLQSALEENSTILISPVVFYEIMRGLYHKNVPEQIKALEKLVSDFNWCDFSRDTWDTGAKLWAKCRKEGKPTAGSNLFDKSIDVDVLIAAQAQEQEAVVVTKNIVHFKYLGVSYESW